MDCKVRRRVTAAALLLLGIGPPATADAQVSTGRIDVTIEDTTGGRLPGVTVDLTGPVSQSQESDALGQAHFLNLPVGVYSLRTNLSGFNTFNQENIQVTAATSVNLPVRLGVAGTAETVNVSVAVPAIDIQRETMTTNLTLEELQNIPNARDPWVLLQSVPTVYVDRINVGGSESGQQSYYWAKGATAADNTWSIDGIPITDMGSTGSSPTYFDFDMFQEMAVTTGGADAQNPTPGVQLTLALKKGSNTPHGNARIYFENEALQAVNISPELAAALGNRSGKGNRTDRYSDYGFDFGGPIIRDRLWAWGSAGKTDVRNITLNEVLDRTVLKNYAFKADGQVTDSVRLNFTFFQGDKIKTGRDAGPTRPAETAWNQNGPTKMYKGEATFVAGQSLFAAVKAAYVDSGFALDPAGGDKDYYIDDQAVWHNSYYLYKSDRPQKYAGADANYFKDRHEVKFGFSWRKTPVDSQTVYPASHLVAYHAGYPNMLAKANRDWRSSTDARYIAGYVTDTISFDRMTVTGGVRFDNQQSSLAEATVPAVSGIPLLPALRVQAQSGIYNWNSVTPRIGVNYSLNEERKTLVRTSYAMFASQLEGTQAKFISPIQYSYVYYNAVDLNGDRVAQMSELLLNEGIQGYGGFDPENPTALSSVNRVGDTKAPISHELLFGIDREVMPNVAVSATVTWRRYGGNLWAPRIGVRQADYQQTGSVTGTFPVVGSVTVPYYAIKPERIPPGGGRESVNHDGYHQRYWGVELTATKRLSNRWMGRVNFSTNDWREYFDDPAIAIEDPTSTPFPSQLPTLLNTGGPQKHGGLVVRQTTGSGKSGIYIVSPKYTMSANGSYRGPGGVNLGVNLTFRQGYIQLFHLDRVRTGDALQANKKVNLVQNVDDFRLPNVATFDLRLEKVFTVQRTNLAIDFDVFNLLNAGTVLGRQYDAGRTGATGFTQVLEIMNPRIARLGVRYFF